MKNEAPLRIRQMLTPKVTMESCFDSEDGGIVAEVRHEYSYPERPGENPIRWAKTITVRADDDGNVYSTQGLF